MSNTDIRQLGTILGIWAHPDDETFMIGGLLAMAADNGQQTICLTATRGEQGGVLDNMADIRTQELAAALDILGVSEHHYLGYHDGACAEVDEAEVVANLAILIDQCQPDSIITFAPDGLTGHPDHRVVSRWASLAAGSVPVYFAVHTQESYDAYLHAADKRFNIYFAVDKPALTSESDCTLLVKLEQPYSTRKLQALQAMPSQYGIWFDTLSQQDMTNICSTEALVAAG